MAHHQHSVLQPKVERSVVQDSESPRVRADKTGSDRVGSEAVDLDRVDLETVVHKVVLKVLKVHKVDLVKAVLKVLRVDLVKVGSVKVDLDRHLSAQPNKMLHLLAMLLPQTLPAQPGGSAHRVLAQEILVPEHQMELLVLVQDHQMSLARVSLLLDRMEDLALRVDSELQPVDLEIKDLEVPLLKALLHPQELRPVPLVQLYPHQIQLLESQMDFLTSPNSI